MRQRTLGAGPTVSEIGLGCMSLTGAYGNGALLCHGAGAAQ